MGIHKYISYPSLWISSERLHGQVSPDRMKA
jgi:hypothetical protein